MGQSTNQVNNGRIARNTLVLYLRTIITLCVSLYTSRVNLDALGIDNFGVYQVVGGLVGMFALISTPLATAISRFITFEIGSGNKGRLKKIFATSVVVQLVIIACVLLLFETVGLWFLYNKLSLPKDNMDAVFWVFQCSVFTFCLGLLCIPYNACLIAHEHMKAFAYVSILDVIFKLAISFLIVVIPFNKLIVYSVLLTAIAVIMRIIYSQYSVRYFEECRAKLTFDKDIFKTMMGFAGWSIFNKSTLLLNTQGVNMLINIYFGVTMNAARGIASQVQSSVTSFVGNFTVAVNPQITKSYAAEQYDAMYTLVCRSAKFSYYVMMFLALPIMCEIKQILGIWLVDVPDYTAIFVILTLITSMIDAFGNSAYTACMATGKLRRYSLIMSAMGASFFAIAWILLACGASVISVYVIFIAERIIIGLARTIIMGQMVGLKFRLYFKQAILPVINVTILACIPAIAIITLLPPTFLRLILSVIGGCTSVGFAALYVGMTASERTTILTKLKSKLATLRTLI